MLSGVVLVLVDVLVAAGVLVAIGVVGEVILVVASFSSLSGHYGEGTSYDPLDRTSRVLSHPS
jgi:hypothetical protein